MPAVLIVAQQDVGTTSRRHIFSQSLDYIGKEANRWEEQYHLGAYRDALVEYGTSYDRRKTILRVVVNATGRFGYRKLAKAASMSPRKLSDIVRGRWDCAVGRLLPT